MPVSYLFVEGNIGAGKSTLLSHIEKQLPPLITPQTFTHVVCVPEPLDAWRAIEHTSNGQRTTYNVLDAFYSDQKRYAFTFQAHALVTRVSAIRMALEAITDPDANILCICERSVYTDRYVFVEMLARAGTLSPLEHAVYCDWWRFWHTQLYPGTIMGVIHVTTPPEQCAKYMSRRDRTEECGVPLAYLRNLHSQHTTALSGISDWARAPILVLSSDQLHNAWGNARQTFDIMTTLVHFVTQHRLAPA